MTENPFYVKLENRGLIKISGPDSHDFLQGLITNDMGLLKAQPCIYAFLLTPQGKFLHDFFIIQHGNELWIDCEGGKRAEDLAHKLTIYKLRSNVTIATTPDITIYSVISPWRSQLSNQWIPDPDRDDDFYQDPRHADMGFRTFKKPDLLEQPFTAWDERRIKLTIPDGSRDMIIGESTLLECNIDKLNGVSMDKGCYVGQELTARMHYRGLAKKHLYTIEGNLPAPKTEIRAKDKLIGEMRSSCQNMGLALLKDAEIEHLTDYKIL